MQSSKSTKKTKVSDRERARRARQREFATQRQRHQVAAGQRQGRREPAQEVEQGADEQEDPDHDLVWGAAGIGKVLNRSEDAAFHMLESGALNKVAKRVGRRWVASRRRLLEYVAGGDQA
jgi:hypothetical protein